MLQTNKHEPSSDSNNKKQIYKSAVCLTFKLIKSFEENLF